MLKIKKISYWVEENIRQFLADNPFRHLRNYMVVVYGIIALSAIIIGIVAINFTFYLALLVLEKLT